jgi:hypothetical protein
MRNPIAKNSPKFNKPKVIPAKKGNKKPYKRKSFSQFMEDGAVTTGTAGVSGAGDNTDKTVLVFPKKKSPVIGMVTRKLT